MRRFSIFFLSVLASLTAISVDCALGQQAESPVLRDVTPAQLQSAYVHGTIDVVVSTREGFVLATDSRGTLVSTNGTNSHSDDQQKAFSIGNRAACVIAGTVGSEMNMEGFRLRDAMGTYLTALDRRSAFGNQSVSATGIGRDFSFGLQGVVGLMLPNVASSPTIAGAISAVSISSDGVPDWVTFYLPLDLRTSEATNGTYFAVGKPIYVHHSQNLGLRFGIEAIGYPFFVQQLILAGAPGEGFAGSDVMKLFYERKQKGHLDEYTLAEAIPLARSLVAATIASAPPDAGVGGPIDILTVTKDGTQWVQRKDRSAPFPPPFRVRFYFSMMGGGKQPLDGLECVRCRFSDIDFSFAGDADVELLSPQIEGHCRLNILPGARRKMPTTVDALTRALSNKCEVKEDD